MNEVPSSETKDFHIHSNSKHQDISICAEQEGMEQAAIASL